MFHDAAPPSSHWTAVFSHNDLGIEHVLVDPDSGIATGIIDWSDAALVDPAYDFGVLLRDLGTAALDLALGAYGGDADLAAMRTRASFYACCSLLEDLEYGLAHDTARHVGKHLSALESVFPAS